MREMYVSGSQGMVGSRFCELLPKNFKTLTPTVSELDITNKSSVGTFFDETKPDYIVHFAAYTDVGAAEKERGNEDQTCWQTNVVGTRNLAEAAKKNGAFMVYISTDYVFPGSAIDPGPYEESHTPEVDPDKLTWYGFTKAEAEREVKQLLGDNCAILRIIYPVRANFDQKLDYIRKPLSLYDQGKLYPLFTDQQVSISFIDEVCLAINKIMEMKIVGIFHASTPDTTSPYELISYAIEKARGVKDAVNPSSLDEFLKTVDNPVRYPKFGGLKVEATERILGIKFSSWREVVEKIVLELKS